MNPKFAAAVAHALPKHQVFAQLVVSKPEAVALLLQNVDATLDALLNRQLGMLEVVTQHRLNQRGGVSPQAEQAEVRQQTPPVQLLGIANGLATQTDEGKQLAGKRVRGASFKARSITVFAPNGQHQAL